MFQVYNKVTEIEIDEIKKQKTIHYWKRAIKATTKIMFFPSGLHEHNFWVQLMQTA